MVIAFCEPHGHDGGAAVSDILPGPPLCLQINSRRIFAEALLTSALGSRQDRARLVVRLRRSAAVSLAHGGKNRHHPATDHGLRRRRVN
jgi:hypothetical protein